MPLKAQPDGWIVGSDYVFDAYDADIGYVRVTLSKEAIEDFAARCGYDGDAEEIVQKGFGEIVEVVDRLHRRSGGSKSLLITTADLNP